MLFCLLFLFWYFNISNLKLASNRLIFGGNGIKLSFNLGCSIRKLVELMYTALLFTFEGFLDKKIFTLYSFWIKKNIYISYSVSNCNKTTTVGNVYAVFTNNSYIVRGITYRINKFTKILQKTTVFDGLRQIIGRRSTQPDVNISVAI